MNEHWWDDPDRSCPSQPQFHQPGAVTCATFDGNQKSSAYHQVEVGSLSVYPMIYIGFRPNTSQLVNWDSFDQQYPPDLDKTQPNSTGCLHDLQSKFTSGRYMSVLFLSWRIQELKATKDSHWTKSIDGWPPSKPGIFNEGTPAFCRKLLFVLVYPHFNNDLVWYINFWGVQGWNDYCDSWCLPWCGWNYGSFNEKVLCSMPSWSTSSQASINPLWDRNADSKHLNGIQLI